MQPIHYSLIINVLVLAICGALAWAFTAPWLIIIAILTQTHALERFQEAQQAHEDEEYAEQPMGFNADIK